MATKGDYKGYIIIDEWYGGLSDGSRSGISGSFRYGHGLDYKTNIDAVTADLALTKDSSTTVTDLIHWFAYDGVQADLYAYGNGGKIYRKRSGTWSLLRTVADAGGEGLAVYDDYLYYRTEESIGRYGALSGAPSFTDAWKDSGDGVETDINFGPITTFQDFVAFGNGRYLATWDGATFTSQRLTFSPGWHVRAIAVRGDYLAIAVNDSKSISRSTKGRIYYWDGISSQYNFINEISEGAGISAIAGIQEVLWIIPAYSGNIYMDTGRLTKMKKIPYIEHGKTIRAVPGGCTNHKGLLTFGLGLGTSEEVYRGIYEYGQYSKDYPHALNFSYPLSCGTTQDSDLEISGVYSLGDSLYAGWGLDGTYGIDMLSTTTLQNAVSYHSRVINLDKEASLDRIKIFTEPLASDESVTISYRLDRATAWTELDTISYSEHGAINVKSLNLGVRATDIEIKLDLSGTTTNMPTVHKIIIEYNEEDRL